MSAPEPVEVAGFRGLVARGGNGERPPVVLVHSAFADHLPYENYLRLFSDAGFDCYAISRRGRAGRPSSVIDGVRVADYCDDVFAVLEEIGGDPIVVGHSLGGVIGQKVAEAERCRMLVLLAAAPPWALVSGAHATLALYSRMPAIVLGRPFMISEAGASRLLLNAMPASDRPNVYRRFPRESGAAFRELLTGRVRVDAAKVRCPVLYVRGDADRVISERVARRIAESYGGEYVEYAGHGHWLAEEPGWERPADRELDRGTAVNAADPTKGAEDR